MQNTSESTFSKFTLKDFPAGFVQAMRKRLGNADVCDDEALLDQYSSDKSEDLKYPPALLVRPKTVEEVSFVLQAANQNGIPVYTRARGTGLAGSSLATRGGICLSVEHLNRIVELDAENLQLTTEPYVLNYKIQTETQKIGLFYPPDPASYRICSIGGNIAMNSSGPKAVKYGGTRNYVLGLEAVLADGTVMQTGSHTLKNSSGYSLTQLLVGSEGTLAVITKAILRLIPLPEYNSLALLTFRSLKAACAAVHGILSAGIVPCGLELMERKALQYAKAYNEVQFPPLSDGIQAHLLIELDGEEPQALHAQRQKIVDLCTKQYQAAETFLADDEQQKKKIWALRRSVYMGIKAHNVIKEMDFCVPIAKLPDMIEQMEIIGAESGFECASYGHAGDGNLHVGVIPHEAKNGAKANAEQIDEGIRRIFAYACSLGGVISGEHGIGLVQKPYLPLLYGPEQLELMRSIKRVFDPKGILNPDKIF